MNIQTATAYYLLFRAWHHLIVSNQFEAADVVAEVRRGLEKHLNHESQQIVLNIFHFYVNNDIPYPRKEVSLAA